MLLDGSYFGHYMMDWDFNHWIPMILGGITVLLALIVILYIIIQSNQKTNEQELIIAQEEMNKQDESKVEYKGKDDLEDIQFCFNCGTKLDDKQLRYCPTCGVKF
jgi:hypothetical protein